MQLKNWTVQKSQYVADKKLERPVQLYNETREPY